MNDSDTKGESRELDHIFEVYEAQLRECFGRVAYSHKTHEKQADAVLDKLGRWKMVQLIVSIVVTGALIVNIFGTNTLTKIAVTVLSAILTFFNSYLKNYDLGQIAQKHKDAADKLWNIRESYISLLADIVAKNISVTEIVKRRDDLQKSLSTVYSSAPRTNSSSYKKAQSALQSNEDLTFSEAEIDAFLPECLKKSKRKVVGSPNS